MQRLIRLANWVAVSVLPAFLPHLAHGQSATGGWQIQNTRSAMTDAPGITMTLRGTSAVRGVVGLTIPEFVVRCHEGTLDAYVGLERVLTSGRDGNSPVRVRYGTSAPVSEQWTRSTDLAGLFVPDVGAFLRGPFVSADTVRVEVQPFDAAPVVLTFSPVGLRAQLPRLQAACPRYRLDSLASSGDARADSLIALVERFGTTEIVTRTFGMSARRTVRVLASRVEGVPCSVSITRVTRGAGGGSASAIVDLKRLTLPVFASGEKAASGAYGRVILRDDAGRDVLEVQFPSLAAARLITEAVEKVASTCR